MERKQVNSRSSRVILAAAGFAALVLAAAPGYVHAQRAEPLWGAAGIGVGVTDSTKWSVRVVPDGSGGAVAAWEENRGRKACCRDTRDIYVQRVNGRGEELWGAEDIRIAGAEDGEEILGFSPWAGGNFLIVWRQGADAVRASVLGSQGNVLDGAEGHLIAKSGADASFEWGPKSCFARSEESGAGLLVWIEAGKSGVRAVRSLVIYAAGSGILAGESELIAEGPDFHGAVAVACRGGGWLVAYWQRRVTGAELYARRVGPGGRVLGESFTFGRDDSNRFVSLEAVSGNLGEVLVLWTAVNPESPPVEHELGLVRVADGGKGAAAGRSISAGRARTSLLYIPETVVTVRMEGMPASSSFSATREEIAWRRSAVIMADNAGGYLLGRLIGGRFLLRSARIGSGGRVVFGPELFVCEPGSGESPEIIRLGRRFMVWWRQREGGATRVRGRAVIGHKGGLAADGEAFEIAVNGGELPGAAAAAVVGPGEAVFWWIGASGKDSATVRMQMVRAAP